MFHFKTETHKDILTELVDLEQRWLREIESIPDEEAVKITLGNLNLISILKKRYFDYIYGVE